MIGPSPGRYGIAVEPIASHDEVEEALLDASGPLGAGAPSCTARARRGCWDCRRRGRRSGRLGAVRSAGSCGRARTEPGGRGSARTADPLREHLAIRAVRAAVEGRMVEDGDLPTGSRSGQRAAEPGSPGGGRCCSNRGRARRLDVRAGSTAPACSASRTGSALGPRRRRGCRARRRPEAGTRPSRSSRPSWRGRRRGSLCSRCRRA